MQRRTTHQQDGLRSRSRICELLFRGIDGANLTPGMDPTDGLLSVRPEKQRMHEDRG